MIGVVATLQQAVGINAVIYFGAQDLKYTGLTTDTAVYEAISLGAGTSGPAATSCTPTGWSVWVPRWHSWGCSSSAPGLEEIEDQVTGDETGPAAEAT